MARVFVQAIFRGQRERLGGSVQGGAVVFVQRFTKTLSVYPHLHVRVLDDGYTEGEDGEVEIHEDPGPSAEARESLEDEVETRLSAWLGRHGYLDETPERRPADGWWVSGAQEPSGVSGGGLRRPRSAFEVNTRGYSARPTRTRRPSSRLCSSRSARWARRPAVAWASACPSPGRSRRTRR